MACCVNLPRISFHFFLDVFLDEIIPSPTAIEGEITSLLLSDIPPAMNKIIEDHARQDKGRRISSNVLPNYSKQYHCIIEVEVVASITTIRFG